MPRQHPDDVMPLPGTQSDQAHPPRGRLIDRIPKVRPDAPQSRAQRRRRIVIGRVPGYPVLHPAIVAQPSRSRHLRGNPLDTGQSRRCRIAARSSGSDHQQRRFRQLPRTHLHAADRVHPLDGRGEVWRCVRNDGQDQEDVCPRLGGRVSAAPAWLHSLATLTMGPGLPAVRFTCNGWASRRD